MFKNGSLEMGLKRSVSCSEVSLQDFATTSHNLVMLVFFLPLLSSLILRKREKALFVVSAEKICGKALRAVDRADLKEMGVRTMGRRILLLGQIQDLFGSSYNSSSTG